MIQYKNTNPYYKIALIVLTLFAFLFYGYYIWNTSFIYNGVRYFTLFDDAMIPMRYAKNMVNGNGFVYNINEYVEGYTDFLWAIYMYIVHVLPIHESKLPLVISLTSLFLLFLNIYFTKKTCETLINKYIPNLIIDNNLLWIYAISFIGLFYALIFWSLLGLEVGIICTIINYIQYRIYNPYKKETRNIVEFSFLFVLLFLIRMDNIIYVTTICAYLLIFGNKKLKFFILPILSIIAAILLLTLFRYFYYHDYLPNTFYLKVSIKVKERLYYGLFFMLQSLKESMGLLCLLIAICIVILFNKKNKDIYLGIIILLASISYSIYVGGDSWENQPFVNRHLTVGINAVISSFLVLLLTITNNQQKLKLSMLIFAIIFISLLIYFLFFFTSTSSHQYFNRFGNSTIIIILYLFSLSILCVVAFFKINSSAFFKFSPILMILLTIWLQLNFYSYLSFYWYKSDDQIGVSKRLSVMGLDFNKHTDKDIKLGVNFAGALPYYSNRYCTDLLGKCEKHIAKGPRRYELPYKSGHMKCDLIYSIKKYDPDVIILLWTYNKEEGYLIDQLYTNHNGFFIKKGSEYKLDAKILTNINNNKYRF